MNQDIDYAWLAEYIEREVRRLSKIVESARAQKHLSEEIVKVYSRVSKRADRGHYQKIEHADETLKNVVPRLEKLREQLAIITTHV
jgi:hypothetical protein